MSRVEELLQIIKTKQDALVRDMQVHDHDMECLKDLSAKMQASEAFDPEDLAAVQAEISGHTQSREHLAKQYEQEEETRKAHQELFAYLNEVIVNRQDTLDQVDSRTRVLESHPELLEYLAKKQLNLHKIIADKLQTLGMHATST
jgi:thioredoxin-like negative regulator of GroEL